LSKQSLTLTWEGLLMVRCAVGEGRDSTQQYSRNVKEDGLMLKPSRCGVTINYKN
jgi:hypothetical protein